MQVLLVNPTANFLADPTFAPPLGLLYLGAALEANGHTPRVVDLNLPSAELDGYDPRLIGVTCTTATFPAARRVVADCRRVYPGIPIAVGGPHLSVLPGDFKPLGADLGLAGDGESWIVEAAGGRWTSPSSVDVDRYPIPARHLLPMERYSCAVDGLRAATIVGARGCPFSCAFCSRWPAARKVRARQVENVIEEVLQLKASGYRALVFHDDEINLLNGRLLSLCGRLAPLGMRLKANARADLFTRTQAAALASAGCSWLCVGVESGSEVILRGVSKGTTPAVNAQARRICREFGIKFKAFVIMGLPGETRETVEETRQWLIGNEVDDLTVTMLVPYPGSAIYDHSERYDVRFDLNYENRSIPFRGAAGLRLERTTRTAGLSTGEIVEFPEIVEDSVRRELGLTCATSGIDVAA